MSTIINSIGGKSNESQVDRDGFGRFPYALVELGVYWFCFLCLPVGGPRPGRVLVLCTALSWKTVSKSRDGHVLCRANCH